MDALVKPVRDSAEITGLLEKKNQKPASIFGLTRCVEPIVMEALRGDQLFTLVVTYDRSRADKLYQDYRFLDRDVYLYPAKDALF